MTRLVETKSRVYKKQKSGERWKNCYWSIDKVLGPEKFIDKFFHICKEHTIPVLWKQL